MPSVHHFICTSFLALALENTTFIQVYKPEIVLPHISVADMQLLSLPNKMKKLSIKDDVVLILCHLHFHSPKKEAIWSSGFYFPF